MESTTNPQPIALDVRPVLAAGEEPFDMIMQAAVRVPAGGALEITAPFEPIPLYRVLSLRGFGHRTEQRDADEFVVHFTRTSITTDARVGEIYERYPATGAVLANYNVDLCCGGELSLTVVAQANGVTVEALLESLQQSVVEALRTQR